jgi:hypothetical protein
MAQLDSLSTEVLRDATGAPYLSAKAYYWSDVGASSPLDTYSDAELTSANTNPVVADGTTGAFPAIYLQAKRYWVTVTTSAGVALTQYNRGPVDGYVTLVESTSAPSPTYKLMYWYDTTTGNLKRRNAANSAWLDLGGIDSLLNAASVTEQLTGTATDKSSTPDSVAALWQRGTDIASAGTLSLPASGGGVYNITGTATINGISSAQGGRSVKLRFAGALTLTHNGTSFILPGAANITTVAGDMAEFINEAAADASGSNWRCFNYQRASGSALNITDQIASQAQMETGSSTAVVVTPGRQHFHQSAAKAWINFDGSGTPTARVSYNITGITDNGVGNYTLNFTTSFSSADYAFTLSCGSGTSTNSHLAFQGSAVPTASAFRVRTADLTAAGFVDATYIGCAFFGDL